MSIVSEKEVIKILIEKYPRSHAIYWHAYIILHDRGLDSFHDFYSAYSEGTRKRYLKVLRDLDIDWTVKDFQRIKIQNQMKCRHEFVEDIKNPKHNVIVTKRCSKCGYYEKWKWHSWHKGFSFVSKHYGGDDSD